MFISLISFVFIILVCVIVHEFGHYITAVIFGVKVHEFSFGMGPLLWQKQGRKNKWSFRALPVGGFVRLAGMGEDDENETVAPGESFSEKAAWKRLIILAAGAFNNILLVVILATLLLMTRGVMDLSVAEIGTLMPGFPAAEAGLREGDVITRVGATDVIDWREMSEAIADEAEKSENFPVTVRRGGESLTFTLGVKPETPDGRLLIGIQPAVRRIPFGGALSRSVYFTYRLSLTMVRGIKSMISHPGDADVSGPVGIAAMAGDAAKDGFFSLLTFLAIISLNLGIVNLLPFPALDGGHIFFTLCEMITRRRLPQRFLTVIHTAGFICLGLLILIITYKDIIRLAFGEVRP